MVERSAECCCPRMTHSAPPLGAGVPCKELCKQLTTLVERELAQYAGASVQLYSEPIIQQRLQQAFDYIFTLSTIGRSSVYVSSALDGVLVK
jgi:hypothetical protein